MRSGLLKPRLPNSESYQGGLQGCPRSIPGFSSWVPGTPLLNTRLRRESRPFCPGETVLDQAAVLTPWPRKPRHLEGARSETLQSFLWLPLGGLSRGSYTLASGALPSLASDPDFMNSTPPPQHWLQSRPTARPTSPPGFPAVAWDWAEPPACSLCPAPPAQAPLMLVLSALTPSPQLPVEDRQLLGSASSSACLETP